MIGTYTCKECGNTKAAASFYSSNRSVCISCLTKRSIEQRRDQQPRRYKTCALCGRRIYMSAARYMRTEPSIICPACKSLNRNSKWFQLKHRISAPCNRIMVPAQFGRCAEFLDCPHYDDCLTMAIKSNWRGWICLEEVSDGENVLDVGGSSSIDGA